MRHIAKQTNTTFHHLIRLYLYKTILEDVLRYLIKLNVEEETELEVMHCSHRSIFLSLNYCGESPDRSIMQYKACGSPYFAFHKSIWKAQLLCIHTYLRYLLLHISR